MITFKKAEKEDIPLLRKLARESWEKAYVDIISTEQIEYMLGTMYSAEEIENHLNHPNYHYFIILEDLIPAGFIGFENHYEKDTTKLHRIYLLEEYKGKGLGKSSLPFLKEQVEMSGDSRIILNVNKSNPAKSMYESQGFAVYGEGVFDIGNGYVMDDFLMEFILLSEIFA